MLKIPIGQLQQLVKINSVSGNEKTIALFLETKLRSLGFATKRQKVAQNRFNLLAEKGAGDRSILFYGHQDTVSVAKNWQTDPFKLCQRGDQLFGLGARDMKSGLVAIMEAIRVFPGKEGRIKIAFCVDEENISLGAHRLLDSGWVKDVSLVVSADSGAVIGKNPLPIRYILGRRGRCVAQVTIPGRTAHGAFPEQGINAISEASKFVLDLKKFFQPRHGKLGKASLFVRQIQSQVSGLSLPEQTTLEIDKQLVPGESPEAFVDKMFRFGVRLYQRGVLEPSLKKSFQVILKPRSTPYLLPYCQTRRNKKVFQIEKVIKTICGRVEPHYAYSVADDNLLAQKLEAPVVCLGTEGGNAHQANEWVSKKSLLALIKIYRQIIKKLPLFLG
ncbi:M20 family metallopeptidase [Patescibacteria group bacterium]